MLGMTKVKGYTKTRERFKLKSYQYEIDKYPHIPHFVEIEVKSDSKNAKALLEKAVKVLGYTIKDTKPWNGFEVHKHYKKKI
jgi:adenylate cyclase class IV